MVNFHMDVSAGKFTQDLGTERAVWWEQHWGAGAFFAGGI